MFLFARLKKVSFIHKWFGEIFFCWRGCRFSVPSGNSVRNVECLVGPRTVNPDELHEPLTITTSVPKTAKTLFARFDAVRFDRTKTEVPRSLKQEYILFYYFKL